MFTFPSRLDTIDTRAGGNLNIKAEQLAKNAAAGRAGERAVGTTGPKTPIDINGRIRIPDRLSPGLLEEVKNVKHLSFTRQLRDFADFAKINKLDFIIHTRSTTTFSGPLQNAFNNGTIIHRTIPGM